MLGFRDEGLELGGVDGVHGVGAVQSFFFKGLRNSGVVTMVEIPRLGGRELGVRSVESPCVPGGTAPCVAGA